MVIIGLANLAKRFVNSRTVQNHCLSVKKKQPKLVFLIETKLVTYKVEYLKRRLSYECCFAVDSRGRSGG
ncbi:hypothetical protein I3843_13G101500 [Carya illinoinensis]|nr:hypothetical protein I3843_13G101500 [Carya illinoinensis]